MQADFFEQVVNDKVRAAQVLQEHIEESKAADGILWIRWAGLGDSESILEKAAQVIPVDQPGYLMVLVQLLGAKIQQDEAESLFPLLQRILLLAPGNPVTDCDYPVNESFTNVSSACRHCIRYMREHCALADVRRAYDAVLSSNSIHSWTVAAPKDIQRMIDDAIEAESGDRRRQAVGEQGGGAAGGQGAAARLKRA